MANIRNDEMRQKILSTSRRLFLEQGYENVSMKEIAESCGITNSLLQHYFRKKDVIKFHIMFHIFAVVRRFVLEQFTEEMRQQGKLAEPLYRSIYYVLLIDAMSRSGRPMIELFAEGFQHAKTVIRGTDFVMQEAPGLWNDPLKRAYNGETMNYVVNGTLSMMLPKTLEKGELSDLNPLMEKTLDIGMYAIDVEKEDRKRIAECTRRLLTEQQREACFAYLEASYDQFFLCSMR